MYAFIWGAFLGASLGLKYGRHVKIETYVEHLPPRAKAASRILVNLIIFAVLWLLVQEVGKVITIESRSTSVSLPWPVPRAWFYSIPIVASCVSMLATCVYLDRWPRSRRSPGSRNRPPTRYHGAAAAGRSARSEARRVDLSILFMFAVFGLLVPRGADRLRAGGKRVAVSVGQSRRSAHHRRPAHGARHRQLPAAGRASVHPCRATAQHVRYCRRASSALPMRSSATSAAD